MQDVELRRGHAQQQGLDHLQVGLESCEKMEEKDVQTCQRMDSADVNMYIYIYTYYICIYVYISYT